ncbi:MAG: sensor histidine kinase, partial [Sphingomonadaceae bacterium]
NEPVLRDSAGQGLALVFHELLTNALKYGALSNDEGHVEVTIEGAENSVSIRWKEHGGPPLDGNKGEGFGTVLISRVFASQASTSLEFPPDGVECRIELDVT